MGGLAIVFIAISFGIPTGLIGRAKGGSFILWFVIGTCLPGFGLLAVILSRNEINEPERQCPNCNKIVIMKMGRIVGQNDAGSVQQEQHAGMHA